MRNNLLVIGGLQSPTNLDQQNHIIANWPKIPVDPHVPVSVDVVVMIAGAAVSSTARQLIEVCSRNNIPLIYTDSHLNELNSKIEAAQKKIEAALDEEAANTQVVETTEQELNMATKKNVKSAKKNARKVSRKHVAKKSVVPVEVQPSNPTITETPKESTSMPTPTIETSTSTAQNSFSITLNPGETPAQALARTLNEMNPKEDRRKTGANTQNAQKKGDFVRELFKKDPSMKTEGVHAAVTKEFGRGLTPSQIHAIRKEFGVAYVGRGKLVNINDRMPVQPSSTTSAPRQAPSYMNEPRGSIEIGSPPDERVWTAVETLKAELGLVSLRVDENGIDYVAQVKGHVERH